MQPITISVSIDAPRDRVWEIYTNPEHIIHWNAASADWYSPRATNDLRPGGEFSYRMEAKDGSEGFDFAGVFTDVVPPAALSYTFVDARQRSRSLVRVLAQRWWLRLIPSPSTRWNCSGQGGRLSLIILSGTLKQPPRINRRSAGTANPRLGGGCAPW